MPMPKNRRYRCRYRYRYLNLEFLHRTLYFSRFQHRKLTMGKFSLRKSILDAFSRILCPKLWFWGLWKSYPSISDPKMLPWQTHLCDYVFNEFESIDHGIIDLVWKLKMRENQNKTVAGYRTDSLRVSADTDTHADTPSIGRYRYRYPGIGRTLIKGKSSNLGYIKQFRD